MERVQQAQQGICYVVAPQVAAKTRFLPLAVVLLLLLQPWEERDDSLHLIITEHFCVDTENIAQPFENF